MELNLKNTLLILFSIIYVFLLQFSWVNLEYYFLFAIGLVFFTFKSVIGSMFYLVVSVVSYIYGKEYYYYLIPVLTLITNFYALDSTKTPSLNRVIHLFIILLYFATQISSNNLAPFTKVILINLISLFTFVRVDALEDSPLKYLYAIVALHNIGQNLSFLTLGLFAIVVFIFSPSMITFVRYGIIASWVYFLDEYNMNTVNYTLCLTLLSTAIISINKDKKMYLSGLMLSLIMFQKNLVLETILIFISLMLVAETTQQKNLNKPC